MQLVIKFLTVFSILIAAETKNQDSISQEIPKKPEVLKKTTEQDLPLRSVKRLHVSNTRGMIQVQGWSQDKIHVSIQSQVQGDTVEEAQASIKNLKLGHDEKNGAIHLYANYGSGLSIGQRLQERKKANSRMDLKIMAPPQLILDVNAVNEMVSVVNWGANLTVRTRNGPIEISEVKAEEFIVHCGDCRIQARQIDANIRMSAPSGEMQLDNLVTPHGFFETDSGKIDVHHTRGNQLYYLKSGSLTGLGMKGQIEYHGQSSEVKLLQVEGSVNGWLESGNSEISILDWTDQGLSVIESKSGAILFSLPESFSGILDLKTVSGKIQQDFELMSPEEGEQLIQDELRVLGRVRHGKARISLRSVSGEIRLKKK